MTLHLIKLSVGSESFEHMAAWQAQRLKDMKARRVAPELMHVTLRKPKQADDILTQGGSIYWVVKGGIIARQKIIAFREVTKNGIPHCGIVYDKKLIPVRWQPRRAFQGWRYLDQKDAPGDRSGADDIADMPDRMRRELVELGLL